MGPGPPSVPGRRGDAGRERPPPREANRALSIDEQEQEIAIARFLFVMIAAGCAVVVVELFSWLAKGVGGRVALRHPFITELVMELAERPWRRR